MKVNERKQQQIKIAHILKDLGLEDDLIEKMTSLKKKNINKIKRTLIKNHEMKIDEVVATLYVRRCLY